MAETVVLSFEVDMDGSIESIESLTKANKELREERKKLDINSVEGKKRIGEINAVLDKNTDKITNNVSALEKQKINIGNYKSALDGVVPGLGGFAQGLDKGTAGFKAMTMQALKFIATPIGAVLAAIVAVFSLLKAAVSGNNQVMDKFENITTAVSAIIDVVVNRVGKLGEALIALSEGNFSKAMDLAGKAVSGLREELEAAVGAAQLYLDVSRQIEDEQRLLRIETAKQENEIKRLVVAAKNRNLTLDEQEGLLRKALKLEQELVSAKELVANKDLQNTTKKLALEQSLRQSEDETFQQFTDRLLKENVLNDTRADAIVEKIEALEQARGSSLAFQEKVENSLAAVQEKRAAALEKQNAALAEQKLLEDANRRAANNPEVTDVDPLIDAFKTQAEVRINIQDRMQADLKKRKDKAAAEDLDRSKRGAALQEEIERQKFAIVGNFIGSLANLAAEDSAEHKVLATAQALINTYLAATAALASGSEINPIFGIISAAAAVASGLASVAKINGVEFAEGGWTGPGHKMKPAGIVHAGEVVWNQEDVARVGGPAIANAMRPTASYRNAMGYSHFDGGLVSNSISNPINQAFEISNMLKNMPAPIVSVKEINRGQKSVRVKQNISKR